MKATWHDVTLAEAPQEDLIRIEGNWYFPPTSLNKDLFAKGELQTECFWKGTAHYYDVTVDGETNEGAAWYYAKPMDGSIEKVGHDFTDYVAFWRGVQVA
ncbi:MAG TPA: DUF427 domain-containing protein [Candidatus Saccharimonadales bacterium]|jgi:uncharacterized protein (DUF427 family)